MDDQQTNKLTGWCKIELMGHVEHIGFVTTETYGNCVAFRIDQPEIPEDSRVTERAGYLDGRMVPKGTTVKRAAIPAASALVFPGSGSIYRITPCTEAAAMKAIEQSVHRPLIPVGLPEVAALPEPDDIGYRCCSGNPHEGHVDGCPNADDDDDEIDEDAFERP